MKTVEQGAIELEAGDKIVAATPHKGYFVAITEKGCVFKVTLGGPIGSVQVKFVQPE